MLATMDGMDGLEMEELVLVCEELEPYVLEFQPGPEVDGSVEAFALAVMRRAEGVLLAMPCDSLPSEVLESGNQEDTTGVFGPSTTITVPGVVQDNGVQSQTGEDVQVLIIDCGRGVVSFLRPIGIDEELDFGFSVDQPMTLPSSDGLLAEAEKWVSSISGRPNFYTAESAAESPVEGTRAVLLPKRPPRRTGRGEGLPSAKKDARPKRVTTAALASSVESLISAIPRLTDQLQVLADRQQAIEDQVAGAPLPPRAQLARPLGEASSTPHGCSGKIYVPSSSDSSAAKYGSSCSFDWEARAHLGRREGEGGSRPDESGESSTCPEPGPHYTCVADRSSGSGPHERPCRNRVQHFNQRCTRTCSAPGGVGKASGHLLSISFAADGSRVNLGRRIRRSFDFSAMVWMWQPWMFAALVVTSTWSFRENTQRLLRHIPLSSLVIWHWSSSGLCSD